MDRVLIVGASCRAAAQSARAAGFEVIALDLFADRDLKSIADSQQLTQFPESVVQLAHQHPSMPIVLAGGMENHSKVVAQLGLRHPLLCASPSQLDSLRDLRKLMQWSLACGIEFPETCLPERFFDVGSKGRPIERGSYLWKPFGSAGGHGICDLLEWMEESTHLPKHASSQQGCIQKNIEGIPIGVVMICSVAKIEIIGTSRSLTSIDWPGPSQYIYRGSIAPYSLPSSIESKIRASALVRDQNDFRGVLGVDFVWQPNSQKLWLLELNPRWTASIELHEWSKGCNLFREHVDACRGQVLPGQDLPIKPLGSPNGRMPVCGKAIVYSTRRLQITDQQSDQLFEKAGGAANMESDWHLADIPMAGVEIQVGSPIVSIFASGESDDRVQQKLTIAREQVLEVLLHESQSALRTV